eukprot:2730506-Rhodomonas_salina.1
MIGPPTSPPQASPTSQAPTHDRRSRSPRSPPLMSLCQRVRFAPATDGVSTEHLRLRLPRHHPAAATPHPLTAPTQPEAAAPTVAPAAPPGAPPAPLSQTHIMVTWHHTFPHLNITTPLSRRRLSPAFQAQPAIRFVPDRLSGFPKSCTVAVTSLRLRPYTGA